MADVCITNLEDALRQTGLSDEMLDDVMAQYHVNRETLLGKDDLSAEKTINTMLATAQKRAEQKKALQLKATERIMEYGGKISYYMENNINPEYWLTDIVDGNTLSGISGGMRGYSTRLQSRTDTLYRRVLDKMDSYAGVDENGNAIHIYSDGFRDKVERLDDTFNRNFLNELSAWQNKLMGDEGHPEFDPNIPEPGTTNDNLAVNAARAFAEMQQENMAVMRALGVDPGEIGGYYLPQKWFPDLMGLGTWDAMKAHVVGIKNEDGSILKGRAAVLKLQNDKREEWCKFIYDRLNLDKFDKNIMLSRYAKRKKDFAKMTKIIDQDEKAPLLSAKLREFMDNPPKSETGWTNGMTALFGKDYDAIRKADGKTRQHKTTLDAIANSSKFSEEQRNIAKELLANSRLADEMRNLSIPDVGTVDRMAVLRGIYDNLLHPSTTSDMFALGASKERELMQMRILQMKDADAFFEVQQKYGYGNAAAHAMQSIRNMAKDQVQLDMFAGNPHNTLVKMCNFAEEQLKAKRKSLAESGADLVQLDKLDKVIKKLPNLQKKAEHYAKFITGVYNRRSDTTVARIINGALQFGRLKLGLSGIAAIGDSPIRADYFRRYWNNLEKAGVHVNPVFLQDIKALGHILNTENWKNPDGTPMFEKDAHVHAILSSIEGNMNRYTPFGNSEISGARSGDFIYHGRQMARQALDKYMDWTFAQRIDEGRKELTADMIGNYLANISKSGMSINDPYLKVVKTQLEMADIGQAEWDIITKRGIFKFNRNKEKWALSANQLERNITVKDIREYLVNKGYKEADITAEDIMLTKMDIVSRFDEFIVANANSAVVTPNLETQLALKAAGGNVDPTSSLGRFYQLFTEFASYPLRIGLDLQRSLRMQIAGVGTPTSSNIFARTGFLVANMYFFGYITFAVRSVLQGRPVPDPFDSDTVTKAMIAGGGLGYAGEMAMDLWGQENVADVSTFLGPTGSTIAGGINLALKAAHGKATEKQFADYFWAMSPNLLFSRMILDKIVADRFYRLFGANWDGDNRIKKWEEKYGTLKDSPLFDQFKKLW